MANVEISGGSTYPTVVTEAVIGQEMIDQYGHVNYKHFPELFESGQNAYMELRGIGFDVIEEVYGLRSLVRAYTVEISGQLFPGDMVQIKTTIKEIGITSVTFRQLMHKGEQEVAKHEMKVVMVNGEGSVPVPNEIREKLMQEPEV